MEDDRISDREAELAALLIRVLRRRAPARRAPPAVAAWEGMAAAFEMLADHAAFMAEREREITGPPPQSREA